MEIFLNILTSFPTAIFSFFLIFCVFYWLIAVLGLIDFDVMDFDMPESNADAGDGVTNMGVISSMLMRLGLQGVPFPITLSILSLAGWMVSYYLSYFIFPMVPEGVFRFLAGIPIFLASFFAAAFVARKLIKPFRSVFKVADQEVKINIVGQAAVVRTSRVDKNFGEADFDDGGAGLIVKVRSYGGENFNKGDKVVLIEYLEAENAYRIVSENEFNK